METTLESLELAYQAALTARNAAQDSFNTWANRRRLSSAPDVDRAYRAAKARRDEAGKLLDAAYAAVEALDPSHDEEEADDDGE